MSMALIQIFCVMEVWVGSPFVFSVKHVIVISLEKNVIFQLQFFQGFFVLHW